MRLCTKPKDPGRKHHLSGTAQKVRPLLAGLGVPSATSSPPGSRHGCRAPSRAGWAKEEGMGQPTLRTSLSSSSEWAAHSYHFQGTGSDALGPASWAPEDTRGLRAQAGGECSCPRGSQRGSQQQVRRLRAPAPAPPREETLSRGLWEVGTGMGKQTTWHYLKAGALGPHIGEWAGVLL